ncbi:hypothetical protein BH10PSE6_BH10PSE6_11160 [soil metagenome]
MTRTQTLIVTTAIAFALPLGAALAQTASATKCGPVAWSTDRMAYTSAPCIGDGAATVAPSGPAASQARTQPTPSPDIRSPMQEQAMAPAPNMAPMGDQCDSPSAATMKDEFGRKYNCRGDRVR